MKKGKIVLGSFICALTLSINASPANDILEITAHLCHLSETINKCLCLEKLTDVKALLKNT